MRRVPPAPSGKLRAAPMAASAFDARQLAALRARLSASAWEDLDGRGAILLRGALPPPLLAPIAVAVARAAMPSTGGQRRVQLTPSLSNGEQGCYTCLGRTLIPRALEQLADEVANLLNERYGSGSGDVFARLSTGEGLCLALQYALGGVNYAHCDQPRGSPYRFQLLVCLCVPGKDFTGGEFYVEDAGMSARRGDGLIRTQLPFESAGDAIIFRACADAGKSWYHGMTPVNGPEEHACRLVVGIGQPAALQATATGLTNENDARWSNLPADAFRQVVRSTFERLTQNDPTWRLSANAFNRCVLSALDREHYAVGQRLRITLSSLRNELEGSAKCHTHMPSEEERRRLCGGDERRVAALLQHIAVRASDGASTVGSRKRSRAG